jgi:hypothetical protein
LTRLKKWLIKKLVGETPIIMNVTLNVVGEIKGAKPEGIFEKCEIHIYENNVRKRGVGN